MLAHERKVYVTVYPDGSAGFVPVEKLKQEVEAYHGCGIDSFLNTGGEVANFCEAAGIAEIETGYLNIYDELAWCLFGMEY